MSLGDLPPRQKMINLMYLVLLCLLAMNVSKEILHSFLIINEGLERTTENFDHKIDDTYAQFRKAYNDDKEKVGPYWDKATKAKDMADEIFVHIKNTKAFLLETADQQPEGYGDTVSLEHVHSLDNQDVGAQIMIGQEVTKPCNDNEYCALKLKAKLEEFNAYIAEIFPNDPNLVEELQIPLEPVNQHGKMEPWEIANFYHLPMAATITNLSRFQAAVKNTEADIVKYMMGKVRAHDFSFDGAMIKVIPRNGTYITQGDTFAADVMIGAYSTTKNPILHTTLNTESGFDTTNASRPEVKNPDSSNVYFDTKGIASYKVKTSSLGEQTWGGVLKIQKPDGTFQHYKFEHKYMVAMPSLVVSPTKMNVFYKGLENPISVSASGMATENLNVQVSGGCKIRPGKKSGEYLITPDARSKAKTVKVTVTSKEEGAKPFEPYEFRLKSVPKPTPFFAGATGSVDMKKSKLRTGQAIAARLEDFLFDLRYRVLSFEMFVSVNGKSQVLKAKNNRLTSQMKGILGKMKPGQTVIFQKVVAQMDKPGSPKVPLNGSIIVHVK